MELFPAQVQVFATPAVAVMAPAPRGPVGGVVPAVAAADLLDKLALLEEHLVVRVEGKLVINVLNATLADLEWNY